MKPCLVVDLGLTPYRPAWELQRRLVAARKAAALPDVLLLCEHPHVITLGRNGKSEHLRASERLLQQMNVEFCATDRGGDITYHGPGQLVGYPILNLGEIRRDVVWYVRQLEEAMIRTAADCGVQAHRLDGKTGIWVDVSGGAEEKLGAIGVHISRWVTSHGFAFNVCTDLRYFDLIVPCGIPDRQATSLERLLAQPISVTQVAARMVQRFGEVFGFQMQVTPHEALEERLRVYAELPAAANA